MPEDEPKRTWKLSAAFDQINPMSFISLVVGAAILWAQVQGLKEDFGDIKKDSETLISQIGAIQSKSEQLSGQIDARFGQIDFRFARLNEKLEDLKSHNDRELVRSQEQSSREMQRFDTKLQKLDDIVDSLRRKKP